MPIFEYECEECGAQFELFFTQEEVAEYLEVEDYWCCKCGAIAYRIVSKFAFHDKPPLSGVDDVDHLTLGKIAMEGKIPAEYRPTIKQVQDREKFRQVEKEYRERVKKYELDKPTKAELGEESK